MSKHIVMPVVILVTICVIVGGLLAITNGLTADKIAQNEIEKTAKLISELLPETDKVNQIESENAQRYQCLDESGEEIGQVVVLSSKGYGGDISVMVGFTADQTVAGIRILSSNETPGLGQKAGEPEFYEQYADKKVKSFIVVKSKPDSDEEISAISGATITSKAVTEAVNNAIAIISGEDAA